MPLVLIKGSSRAAFLLFNTIKLVFIFFLLQLKIAAAQSINYDSKFILNDEVLVIAKHPTWSALLHVTNGKPSILDPNFLLSSNNFSLENELLQTIDFLYAGNQRNVCKFPARYLWLREKLNLPVLLIDECDDFQEFKRRAPSEQISITFASENLAQPSSMMGHVFLKLSGKNEQGKYVEHAISFFTDAGTLNLPKLFYDSMIVGKTGYFSLSPYQEKIDLYLMGEQRSIWEYDLRLNSFQKNLIQAHLIELKQTALVYFFQKYNCATVIDFILLITANNSIVNTGFWITPKDVIKRAQEQNLIQESRLLSPSRWTIRAISSQLADDEISTIKNNVEQLNSLEKLNLNQDKKSFLKLELAKAYHKYRIETKLISQLEGARYADNINQLVNLKFRENYLEANKNRDPINSPQDAQVEMGYVSRKNENFIKLTFTPASHHLVDNNSQYFSENELILFETSLLKNLSTKKLELEHLIIYSARSLIPYDRLSGGLSGAIRIGIEPELDAQFKSRKTALIRGALGLTKRVNDDIDFFVLVATGLTYRGNKGQVSFNPEIGMIAREVFDMKSIISLTKMKTLMGDQSSYYQLQFTQSKYFANQDYSVHLNFTSQFKKSSKINEMQFSFKKLF